MIDRALKLAMVVAMAGAMTNIQAAHAGCDNGGGNDGVNNGRGNGACGGGADEAPLPLLGASPLALMAIGGALGFKFRRRNAEA